MVGGASCVPEGTVVFVGAENVVDAPVAEPIATGRVTPVNGFFLFGARTPRIGIGL